MLTIEWAKYEYHKQSLFFEREYHMQYTEAELFVRNGWLALKNFVQSSTQHVVQK